MSKKYIHASILLGILCMLIFVALIKNQGNSTIFQSSNQNSLPQSVIIPENGNLECNLSSENNTIESFIVQYSCQAPGAYLTHTDVSKTPWTADYFITNTQQDSITYGPVQVKIEENLQ